MVEPHLGQRRVDSRSDNQIMIVFDERNPKARSFYDALSKRLPDGAPAGVIVVLGGDGFMLRAVSEHGRGHAYLGLNAGHLGFLHNEVDADWDVIAARITGKLYRAFKFPLLKATIRTVQGKEIVSRAMNDVYMERATGQTALLNLEIDGHSVVEGLVADGIIFATALGSTAYSYSAGGSPSHPALRVLKVTPICPHLPRLSPFDIPDVSRATVTVQLPERRAVRVVADGRSVDDVSSLEIGFGNRYVRLVYFQGHDFTRNMLQKIVRPG